MGKMRESPIRCEEYSGRNIEDITEGLVHTVHSVNCRWTIDVIERDQIFRFC